MNRTDNTQNSIVSALRSAGCSVIILSQAGRSTPGCPDLGVGYHGKNYFLECKSDNGKLTEAEQRFQDTWKGSYFVVRTPSEAFEAIGIKEVH